MRTSNRRKILDAIIAIVERDGITAVTFDAVAAETGLTRGGLLYHFPSREALLRGIDRREQALALAQRLSGVLAQPWQIQAQEQALSVCIGASIGLAMYPEHGEDPEALLANADRAMYLSKMGHRTGSLARPLPPRGMP